MTAKVKIRISHRITLFTFGFKHCVTETFTHKLLLLATRLCWFLLQNLHGVKFI